MEKWDSTRKIMYLFAPLTARATMITTKQPRPKEKAHEENPLHTMRIIKKVNKYMEFLYIEPNK